MVVDQEKTVRLLKEAILQLCRVSLMGSFEVDGIICISPSNTEEERQLVIKVHEQVSEEAVNGQDARDKRKQRDVHRNKTMFALKCNNELEDSVETTHETASPWKNSGSDANSWVSDFTGCISGNSWRQVNRMLKMQPASGQRHRASSRNHEEEIQELSIKKTVRKIEDSFYFACKLCAMAFASKIALDSHVEQCSQKNSRNECGDRWQLEEREGRTFQQRITRKRKQQKPSKGFDDVIDPNNANVKILSSNFQGSSDSILKASEFHSNMIPSTDELSPVERETVNPLVSDLFHSPENVATSSEQKSDGTTAMNIKSEGSCLCQMCNIEFSDFTLCSIHYKTVHNVYACAYCQEKFSNEQLLEDHLAVHAEQELSDCLLCGLTLMRRSALFAHHQQVHGLELESNGLPNSSDLEEPFVEKDAIDVAGEERMFPKLEEFGSHHEEKVDSSVNNIGFESGNQLLRSQNKSSHGVGNSNFVSKRLLGWSAFNPKFQRPLDRRDWPSLGDDEKVYECDKCRELIQGTGVYQLHCKKLHRRTPCLHCGKTFSQKGNMERHMRLHTGVKPYRCHLCRRSFCRKEALLGHVGQDHSTSLRSSL